MSPDTFVKLFQTVITSSLWQEDSDTRIVFITMLAMADKNGMVSAAVNGIASISHVPLENTKRALEKLSSPDPYSRSKNDEGRRIREVPGGWMLINHAAYRNKRSSEERREYQRTFARERTRNQHPIKRVPASNEPHAPFVRQTSPVSSNSDPNSTETPEQGVLDVQPPNEWYDEYGNEVKGQFRTPEVMEAIQEWYDYKDERKESYGRVGSSNFIRALHAMPSPEIAVKAIRASMAANWMGVHIPRELISQTHAQKAPLYVQLRILEDQIAKHPANPQSIRYVNGEATEELRGELARMRARAASIKATIVQDTLSQ